jgi:hypothetical protein
MYKQELINARRKRKHRSPAPPNLRYYGASLTSQAKKKKSPS